MTELPLEAVVGRNVRRIREALKLTQDDVATTARWLGVNWARSSIGLLEQGKRNVSLAEAILLVMVLNVAQQKHSDTEPAHVSLASLLSPDEQEAVFLTTGAKLSREVVEATLSDAVFTRTGPMGHAPWEAAGQIERNAAADLGLTPGMVAFIATLQWGHNISTERDRRFDADPANRKLNGRSAQAKRGQITRQLLDELRPRIESHKEMFPQDKVAGHGHSDRQGE